MPSGHPKDPVATAKKRAESREARAAKRLEIKKSDEALKALREKLTGDNPYPRVGYPDSDTDQIESLKQTLETEIRINDDLCKRLAISERRLMTVLDLVSKAETV